jgi:hypothetical protein
MEKSHFKEGESMRKIFLAVLAFSLLSAFLPVERRASAAVRTPVIKVNNAEGRAPVVSGNKAAALKEAKLNAYRDALRQAIGDLVYGDRESEQFMENSHIYSMTRDKIFSQAQGVVKKFKVKSEKIEDGTAYVTGSCEVEETALDGVLGPAIIDAMGNPRVVLLISERIGGKPASVSNVADEARRVFGKAGYLILDGDRAGIPRNVDPLLVYDEPGIYEDAAGNLKAEILLSGVVETNYLKGAIAGISAPIYHMKAKVRLKAVFAATGYLLDEKSVEVKWDDTKNTDVDKTDAYLRHMKQATTKAAGAMVYKTAYALAFGAREGTPGVVVNVKVGGVAFGEIKALVNALNRFVGKDGGVYQRNYQGRLLEIDVASNKSGPVIAEFLSGHGIDILSYTSHAVSGTMAQD